MRCCWWAVEGSDVAAVRLVVSTHLARLRGFAGEYDRVVRDHGICCAKKEIAVVVFRSRESVCLLPHETPSLDHLSTHLGYPRLRPDPDAKRRVHVTSQSPDFSPSLV